MGDGEDSPENLEDLQKPSKEIGKLMDELQEILENYSTQDMKIAESHMKRAAEIKREIERAGFPVTWTIVVNPENPSKPEVKLGIVLPKKNMTPKERMTYDKWFATVNNLPEIK